MSAGVRKFRSSIRRGGAEAFIAGVALLFLLALQRLHSGYLFNSFPFISDDGFEWLQGGHALASLLSGASIDRLSVLRPPGFVWVTAADVALGGDGRVILTSFALALALGAIAILRFGDALQVPRSISVALVIVYGIAPINSFRLWLLSDVIAVALMLWSVLGLMRWLEEGSSGSLGLASGLALAAGLTQTYGMIPFFGIGLFVLGMDLCTRRTVRWRLLQACVAVCSSWLAATALWRAAIPHDVTPSNFSLIRFDLEMLPYYLQVWAFVFTPLLPLMAAMLWPKGGWHRHDAYRVGSLWLCVAAFALLSLLYHWEESRFTLLWFGLFLMATLTLAHSRITAATGGDRAHRRIRLGAWVSCALVLVQSFFLVPANYWSPSLGSMRWKPEQTWLAKLYFVRPIDRFDLAAQCGSPSLMCQSARAPSWTTPNELRAFHAHRSLLFGEITTAAGKRDDIQELSPRRGRYALEFRGSEPAVLVRGEERYDLGSEALMGHVDRVRWSGKSLQVEGWAFDATSQRLPDTIVVFLDDRFVGTGGVGVLRSDVVSALGSTAFERSGFDFASPLPAAAKAA
ncbi:MAG: hypothetical protein CL908_03110, partial [Deltaproteobacteria bacterium]|nr:hypothetical protein [Deltaproteobacteria bacterium]